MNQIDEACEWLDRHDAVERTGWEYGVIRIALVRELLQQVDNSVQQPQQSAPDEVSGNPGQLQPNAPSRHQVLTVPHTALQELIEDAEDMGVYKAPSGNQDSTTGEKEPKPDWEGFGRAVIDAWLDGCLDDAEIQDYAEHCGLLRKEPDGYDPEKHGVDPSGWWPDPEPGDEWWVPTYPVKRRELNNE